MARIAVMGAGVAGLTAAMMLAGDGHEAIVLERDATQPPVPGMEAWDWERRGVNQFHLLHTFLPRFRRIVGGALPSVVAAAEAAGALGFNIIDGIPAEVTGGRQDGDDRFEQLTARRPVMEAVLSACAEQADRVTVRRGVAVAGLLTGTERAPGVPHVTGVRTTAGEDIAADVVVDATGRRSPLPDWLEAIGARRPAEELEDSGFMYYGRHFRGTMPVAIGPPVLAVGSITVLTLAGDNDTWGVGIITSAKDAALRPLRDPDRWDAAMRSLPLMAHWIEGEPLEDEPVVMAKIEDRHRSFVVDGVPVATGVFAVGDSWACTNPSLGRGASVAAVHVEALRDLLRSGIDDPLALATEWHDVTLRTVEPFYRGTLSFDRHRLAEIESVVRGEEYAGDDEWERTQALGSAGFKDPDCFRAFLDVATVYRPAGEVLADAPLMEKAMRLGAGWRDEPLLGPSRSELLKIAEA